MIAADRLTATNALRHGGDDGWVDVTTVTEPIRRGVGRPDYGVGVAVVSAGPDELVVEEVDAAVAGGVRTVSMR